MDMEMLLSGIDYDRLPDSYVIFICDYDPFEQGKYRYTITSRCAEYPDLDVADGIHTIILNNRGSNPEEVPKGLVHFLQYTKESLADSGEYSEDAYIQRIQESIRQVKGSREMGERYMTLQEMLKEERQEGKQEGRLEGLTVVRRVNTGELTLEEGADELDISVDELREIMDAHPKAPSAVNQEGKT